MRAWLAALLVLATGLGALAVLALSLGGPGARAPRAEAAAGTLKPAGTLDLGTAPSPLAVRLDDPVDAFPTPFKRRTLPAAGLVFDVDTGDVLWRRHPTARRPIASLTKMMTGLVVADRLRTGSSVRISSFDAKAPGSAVGALPVGRRIGVETLLYGLMLPSGNDAARALAHGTGGSQRGFVRLMNQRARLMHLGCTRYATPDGYMNRGNHSCAADLAAEARAVLRTPRLARIVRRAGVVLPWPVKRGKRRKLFLTNHNPLLRRRYPGVTGVKTGYTNAAGACFVVTARRGGVHLGVVLLDSPDIDRQARTLLRLGFRAAARR